MQLSPATEKVYEELKSRGEPTRLNDLTDLTGLASRTVRYSLASLMKHGLVGKKLNFRDMRGHLYFVNTASV